MTKETFTVIYRTGGTLNAKWHRVLEVYPTMEATRTMVNSIERMGYKTLVHRTHILNAIGMPEGWEAR